MTDPSAVADLLGRLRSALHGTDPIRLDISGDGGSIPAPPGTAVVLRTSGSTTGTGKPVAISATALRHSAQATHTRLGGPGQWLLAVPAGHIAGIQVLVRSILAGHDPVVLDPGPFDPRALAVAIDSMRTDVPRYTSLVPTQLYRALAAGARVRAALASCQAVLVGGAALDPSLLAEARHAGIQVVRTYGMTETSGGCVYDGVPLEGVQVHLEGERVLIAGPVLATGYLAEGAEGCGTTAEDPFVVIGGVRWLRTQDAGTLTSGRLHVLGRLDEVILTGGVNVHPAPVERTLRATGTVGEAVVVGVPDAQWGHLLTAVVTGPGTGTHASAGSPAGAPDLATIRAAVAEALGPGPHVPRALVVLDQMPLRGPGKVDRLDVTRKAASTLAAGSGQRYPDR